MAIKVRAGLAAQWEDYPQKEGEEGGASRFYLRPLTSLELVDFRNEVYKAPDGEIVVSGRGVNVALGAVLKWENVFAADGMQLAFSEANKELLPPSVLVWLSVKVFVMNILQEIERKNS